MVQGKVILKEGMGRGGGGWGLAFFLLNFFKVYNFYIQKLIHPL